MERGQVELRHGKGGSFGGMGKVYFSYTIDMWGEGDKAKTLVGAKLVVLVCP